jgi:hypothetical protein
LTFWSKRRCSDKVLNERCTGKFPGECSRGRSWACSKGVEFSGCKDKSDLVCDYTQVRDAFYI